MRIESICLGPLATNCYLVESGGMTLLIDPAEDSDRLRSFLDGRRVDFVVDTHGHFDHVGGNWAANGAPVCCHEADLPYLDHAHPGHPPVDRYLKDGDELSGLRVLHTPGHSPGSIVLAGDHVLFVGDLLFAGSVGRTDLPGGSPRRMAESLRRIARLPGEYTVYPGHGPPTTLERERRTNPFLTAQG